MKISISVAAVPLHRTCPQMVQPLSHAHTTNRVAIAIELDVTIAVLNQSSSDHPWENFMGQRDREEGP